MQSGSLNQKLNGLRSKATRRRAIALLSAVVMLITMNTLKLDADTLERIPTCGYAEEHVHDESCYIDGELSCGLEAHVHTDACYQERPVIAEPETEIYAEAEEEVVVSAEPVDSDAVETEAYMSGEEAQDAELPAIADAVVEPAFSLAGRDYITASEIAGALSLSPEAVVGVSEVIPEGVDAEDYLPVLKIEQVGEDYIVIPARDFAECEIAIETDAELIAVKLTEGAALAAAEPEPQDDEVPERQEPDPDAPKADEAEEEPVPEDEPDSEAPVSEDETDSEEPVSEDETDSEEPVSEDETDSEEPVSEDENDSEEPISEDETDSEEPASEDEDAEGQPEADEASGDAPEAEGPDDADAASDEVEDDADAPSDEVEDSENAPSDETEDDAQDDAQAPSDEPDVAPQASARYTVVVDLAEVEAYPLYLNALLAMAAPTEEIIETAPDSAPTEEIVEDAPDPAPTEEITEAAPDSANAADEAPAEGAPLHAEPADDAAPETVASLEDAAPDAGQAVEYDPALLSVVPVDGDYAVTPVSDFDEAVISTGETTVTLLNGRLEAAYPAQSFTASLPGITVTAAAEAGALPMGTVMSVTEAGDAAASIAEAVEDAFVRVDRVHAVDITFTDALGAEVEPRVPVSVSLAVEKVEDDQSAVVVHLTDDGEAEVVPIPADEAASAGEADDAAPAQGPARVRVKSPARAPAYTRVEFDADAFSVYAVVVTRRLETNFLDSAGDTYRITVEYAEGARIPEGATLRVEEAEGEEYLAAAEAALEGGKRVAKGRFFDISILDAEGEKVQPDEPVQVSVTLLGDAGVSEPGAHVVDDGEPVAVAMHFDGETAVVETRAQDEAVVFEAEGFSVWGVVYTVDFYYGDYDEYHIAGGGATTLSDLVEQLNIAEDGRAFAAEVADVWFSAPELVFAGRAEQACTVGQMVAERGLERAYSAELTVEELAEIDAAEIASGDWALISLQAFDTEERLTIAMNDGAVYVVRVKDAQIAARVLTADGETFIVTVTYGPEAEIPEGAALNAREITSEEEEEYQALLNQASAILGEANDIDTFEDEEIAPVEETDLSLDGDYSENEEAEDTFVPNEIAEARFFDISIVADGAPIEPAAAVQVSIAYVEPMSAEEDTAMTVVHFAETGTETLTPTTVADEMGVSRVSFVTESFSKFGTIVEKINETTIQNNLKQHLIAYFSFDTNNEKAWIADEGHAEATLYMDAGNTNVKDRHLSHGQSYQGMGKDGYGFYTYNDTNKDENGNIIEHYFWLDIKDSWGQPLLKNDLEELTISFWAWPRKNNDTSANWMFYAAPNDNTLSGNETYLASYIHKNKNSSEEGNYLVSARRFKDRNGDDPGTAKTYTPDANAWHHYTVVYGKDSTQLYVDGNLAASEHNDKALKDILGSNSIFHFGKANYGNGEHFKGSLDELSLYNYAMNPTEVKHLYEAYKSYENQKAYTTPRNALKVSATDLVSMLDAPENTNKSLDVVIYAKKHIGEGQYEYYAIDPSGYHEISDVGGTVGWMTDGDMDPPIEWIFKRSESGAGFEFINKKTGKQLYQWGQYSGYLSATLALRGLANESYGTEIEVEGGLLDGYGLLLFEQNEEKQTGWNSPGKEHTEFMFAIVDPLMTSLVPNEVPTVDSVAKGITIKMYDWGNPFTWINADGTQVSDEYYAGTGNLRSHQMTYTLGEEGFKSGEEGLGGTITPNIVASTLEDDGFPKTNKPNYQHSLNEMFNEKYYKGDANNLFLKSIYSETGYFEYNSADNYAYYNNTTRKFEVYRQIGAPHHEKLTEHSYKKGNFFPYNSLDMALAKGDVYLYDDVGNSLGENDPRLEQIVYYIPNPNYLFGMSMETKFYQAKDGIDQYGDPVVFEFNGDDDMWVYIDGVLVLDIGGVHGPVGGSINFKTGEVKFRGVPEGSSPRQTKPSTTIKKMFEEAKKLPNGDDWDADRIDEFFEGETLKDYTLHTMKMFYMERGGGASNLHLKFNIPILPEGTFLVEKTLDESNVQAAYGDVKFAYQAYLEDSPTTPLKDGVNFKTGKPLEYANDNSGTFYLRPGDQAEFKLTGDDAKKNYYIRELGVAGNYNPVIMNGQAIAYNEADVQSSWQTVADRSIVNVTNVPVPRQLKIHKALDIGGQTPEVNAKFTFKVYLEDTYGTLVPYVNGKYSVMNGNDKYLQANRENYGDDEYLFTATDDGEIIVPADATAIIDGLLPGIEYKVEEILSDGYKFVGATVNNESVELTDANAPTVVGHIHSGNGEPVTFVSYTNTLPKISAIKKDVDKQQSLNGAVFTLKKGSYLEEEWVDDDKFAERRYTSSTVGEEKGVIFKDLYLSNGTYLLTETKAPDGYNLLPGEIQIVVGDDGIKVTYDGSTYKHVDQTKQDDIVLTVLNTPGYELPSTGGPGTTAHMVSGLGLVLFALALLLRKRRI